MATRVSYSVEVKMKAIETILASISARQVMEQLGIRSYLVQWVESIRGEVSLSQACAWIGLPQAAYYRWKVSYEAVEKDSVVGKFANSAYSINFGMDTGRSRPCFV